MIANRVVRAVGGLLALAFVIGHSLPNPVTAEDGGDAPQPSSTLENGEPEVDAARRALAPSREEQRRATAKVREIFADDYAGAKTPVEKQRLASTLFDASKKTRDAADAWALVCEAVRLAAEAGDVARTLEMVDALANRYEVDHGELRLDALTTLADKASPQSAEAIARHLLNFAAGHAHPDGKLEARTIQLAAAMARKAKNPQLATLIAQTQVRRRREEAAAKELDKALARVKGHPDDATASLEAGSLLCFTHGDWKAGLPLLARGDDPALAALARRETAAAGDAEKIVAVADAWANWAEGQKPPAHEGANIHARDLFARVVPRLEGLERTRVEKRMANLAAAAPGSLGRAKDGPRSIPGLTLWLDAADPSAFADDSSGQKRSRTDRVAIWKDLSGRGNDALQPDPAKQPRRLPTAVAFDGSQFLSLGNALPGTAVTVLAVYRSTRDTSDTTLASTRTASTSGWMIDHQGGSIWLRGFGEASTGQAVISPSTPEGIRVFVGSIDDSGRVSARLAAMKLITSAKPLVLKPSPTPLAVGGKTGDSGGSNFRGELQRLVIYSRALDDAELAALLGWNAKTLLP
jgi:hypothetical protein